MLRQFWQRLDGPVHPDDRPVLESYPTHTFDLRFPPPAFIGDVESAPLVVLMLNGGVAADLERTEFPPLSIVRNTSTGSLGEDGGNLLSDCPPTTHGTGFTRGSRPEERSSSTRLPIDHPASGANRPTSGCESTCHLPFWLAGGC